MKDRIILIVSTALLAMGGPADARVNTACKSKVAAIGSVAPTKSKAAKAAKSKWVERVAAGYGSSWSHLSLAKNKNLACRGGNTRWACRFDARPCGRVSYQTPKAHRNNPAGVRP